MIESFMQSQHIAEIFVDDAVLRKRMSDVLKKHMQVDEELDEEVRRRIKNLEEGTSTWEVEYGKVLDQNQAEPRPGPVVPSAPGSADRGAALARGRGSFAFATTPRTSSSTARATPGSRAPSARNPGVV